MALFDIIVHCVLRSAMAYIESDFTFLIIAIWILGQDHDFLQLQEACIDNKNYHEK